MASEREDNHKALNTAALRYIITRFTGENGEPRDDMPDWAHAMSDLLLFGETAIEVAVPPAVRVVGETLALDVLRCIPADWKPEHGREWGHLGPILAEFIDDLREGRYPTAPAHAAAVTDAERYGLGYGFCPVQISGIEGDRQYYFRSRHEDFALSFGEPGDMTEYAAVGGEVFLRGSIDSEFSAGYMPHALAKALTDWGLECWRALSATRGEGAT